VNGNQLRPKWSWKWPTIILPAADSGTAQGFFAGASIKRLANARSVKWNIAKVDRSHFCSHSFGRWCPDANAVTNAKHYMRSHNAVIWVYDEAGNVIETHEHAGDFKEW
jgi:hypothetical protein